VSLTVFGMKVSWLQGSCICRGFGG